MSTQSQIHANRENASHSTGPRTEEGKAASSQNRVKHRLSIGSTFRVLPDESQDQFDAMVKQIALEFQPTDLAEASLVMHMAEHRWMSRRALAYQEDTLLDDNCFRREQFALFMRYEAQHERAYNACVSQLLKLRAAARSVQIGFDRQENIQRQQRLRVDNHKAVQKSRQVDADCKLIRAFRAAADNPEALTLVKEAQARFQAA